VPLTEAAWASRSTLDQLSKSDSLDLADHNLVFRSVVELGRARLPWRGNLEKFMSFRFRKRIRLGKFLRVNLSKSGAARP
jgi:hypothetical protein